MKNDRNHSHSHGANKRVLLIGFILITGYMVIEVIGGLWTNSLALLADAGHMLSDSLSLGIGLLALILGEKSATSEKTYGYKRFEILAALFNGVTLSLVAVYIFYEAFHRFQEPLEIASRGMLLIAAIGLLVNLLVAWILLRGDTKENLNVRAAFLHVISDLLGSVGAIVAAFLILFFGWVWADPIASILVAVLVFISGWRVTGEAVHVLMEGTPRSVEVQNIARTLEQIPGVHHIHDLHIWSITSGKNALSCHAEVDGNMTISESQVLLETIEQRMKEKGIGHVTVQFEGANSEHPASFLCVEEEGSDHTH